MAAARYDITIEQGATWELNFTYSVASTPFNLTGWGIRSKIRQSQNTPASIYLATPYGEGITATPLLGDITLVATATQTQSVNWERGIWDVEIFTLTATPTVKRLLKGLVKIDKEATF